MLRATASHDVRPWCLRVCACVYVCMCQCVCMCVCMCMCVGVCVRHLGVGAGPPHHCTAVTTVSRLDDVAIDVHDIETRSARVLLLDGPVEKILVRLRHKIVRVKGAGETDPRGREQTHRQEGCLVEDPPRLSIVLLDEGEHVVTGEERRAAAGVAVKDAEEDAPAALGHTALHRVRVLDG